MVAFSTSVAQSPVAPPAAPSAPLAAVPIVLIPGLSCSPRLFAPQIPALWQWGPVTVAETTRHASMAELAQAILHTAPPQFVLMGLSMGGYIAFEIMRQAPERVLGLVLLDTSARPDTAEATENRLKAIELAQQGKMRLAVDFSYPRSVHPSKVHDGALRSTVHAMAQETGVAGFVNQQTAIIARADSRPSLAAIACPTLVLVGDSDGLTPPALHEEIAHGIGANAQLQIVPGCGHISTLEQPEAVSQALEHWLQAHFSADSLARHGG